MEILRIAKNQLNLSSQFTHAFVEWALLNSIFILAYSAIKVFPFFYYDFTDLDSYLSYEILENFANSGAYPFNSLLIIVTILVHNFWIQPLIFKKIKCTYKKSYSLIQTLLQVIIVFYTFTLYIIASLILAFRSEPFFENTGLGSIAYIIWLFFTYIMPLTKLLRVLKMH